MPSQPNPTCPRNRTRPPLATEPEPGRPGLDGPASRLPIPPIVIILLFFSVAHHRIPRHAKDTQLARRDFPPTPTGRVAQRRNTLQVGGSGISPPFRSLRMPRLTARQGFLPARVSDIAWVQAGAGSASPVRRHRIPDSMNSSSSPSRTLVVLPVSVPVRRSLTI